jgi:hypothetical protein
MQKISNLALAFAFLMPLAGCPGDDTGGTDTVAMTTAPTTTMDPTAGTTTDDPTAGTTVVDPTAAVDSSSSGGGGGGACQLSCAAVADCAQGGPEDPWACTEGFCVYTAPPCDPAMCPAPNACADVGGVSSCITPCDDDTMCAAGFTECTGVDDDGNSYCAALPVEPCGGVGEGEACEIPMFGSLGTCTDGVCTCMDDAECTAPNYACNG